MMEPVCVQCNKQLDGNDEITRIVDRYIYTFCSHKCELRWILWPCRR